MKIFLVISRVKLKGFTGHMYTWNFNGKLNQEHSDVYTSVFLITLHSNKARILK